MTDKLKALAERLRQRAKPIRERLSAPTATDLRESYDSMLTEAADAIIALIKRVEDAERERDSHFSARGRLVIERDLAQIEVERLTKAWTAMQKTNAEVTASEKELHYQNQELQARVNAMEGQDEVSIYRLMKKEQGIWEAASEYFTGAPDADWEELVAKEPAMWSIQRRVTGKQIADGIAKALAPGAAPKGEQE